MKRNIRSGLAAILAVTVCLSVSLSFQINAQAQQNKPTAVEGVKFDAEASLADNLKTFGGKDVFVHLRSGITIQGYVKSVGKDFLHIEKLAGRDFYDALIRMEDISAIETKFRDMK